MVGMIFVIVYVLGDASKQSLIIFSKQKSSISTD